MTKVFLLLLVFSYHFVQAEEEKQEPCPPGKVFYPPAQRCVDIPPPMQEVRKLSTASEKEQAQLASAYCESCLLCTYLEGAKTMNQSATKCPELSALSNSSTSTTKGAGSCSTVDARCLAKVRCYPRRTSFSLPTLPYPGDQGVQVLNIPPFEMNVSCAVVDGKCPENPQDCIKDTSVAITTEGPSVVDVEESLRRRTQEKRPSGTGVR